MEPTKASSGSRFRSFGPLIFGFVAIVFVARLTVEPIGFYPWVPWDRFQPSFEDLLARLAQVHTAGAGGNVYVPFGDLAFTYPPAALFLFWPFTWLSLDRAEFAWTLMTLFSLSAAVACALSRVTSASRVTIFTLALWLGVLGAAVFEPVQDCLAWGQTSTFLLLLVALDVLVIHKPHRGVLVGVATAVKLYPGVIILFWLWRREWKPALTSLASFAITTGVAWFIWPSNSVTFFLHRLFNGGELNHFRHRTTAILNSSSVYPFFYRAPFHAGSYRLPCAIAASLVVLAIGVASAAKLWRQNYEVASLSTLLITSCIISPVAWDHYFAFAPLLLVSAWETRRRHWLSASSTAAALVMVVPWDFYRESGNPLEAFITQNALLAACLLVVGVGWLTPSSPIRHLTGSAAARWEQNGLMEPPSDSSQ